MEEQGQRQQQLESNDNNNNNEYTVLLFYRFLPLTNLATLQDTLRQSLEAKHIKGRILLAPEGINGTLAVRTHNNPNAVAETIQILVDADVRFQSIDWKTSIGKGTELPFVDLFIKLCKELIGTGLLSQGILDDLQFSTNTYGGLAEESTGVHLPPAVFHEKLLQSLQQPQGQQNMVLIDVRNDIEYEVGHFQSAMCLNTPIYSGSWKKMDEIVKTALEKDKDTAIFSYCTGGIRCEVASAYLIRQGINRKQIFQLEGGIHKYLEEFPNGGLFQGKNYVFDQRVLTTPDQYTAATASANPTASPTLVVGQCLVCLAPYDIASNERVCCVCRMDVLVCETCVRDNPHPDEYHCKSHRHLKDCYFKKLDGLSKDELLNCKSRLMEEEKKLLSLGRHGKNKRRTLRNQTERINQILVTFDD